MEWHLEGQEVCRVIFHLIRHGQSENNARPDAERVHDPEITELGHVQAKRIADRLLGMPVTRLVSSPFLRTLQTTAPTAQSQQKTPVELWIEIHEVGGCYSGHLPEHFEGRPGMNRSEISEFMPGIQIPRELNSVGWWNSQPKETPDQAGERVGRFWNRIQASEWAESDQIAFFSHADFISTFSRIVHPDELNVGVRNGSFSSYRWDGDNLKVLKLNCVEHLEPSECSL